MIQEIDKSHDRSDDPNVMPKALPSATWVFSSALVLLTILVAMTLWFLHDQNESLREELAKAGAIAAAQLTPELERGDPLPPVQAMDLAGNVDTLTTIAAGKPLIVAVFHTTCPYCQQTLPVWQELNIALSGDGAQFVGISLHGRSATARYRSQHRLPWPVWIVSDSNSVAALGITSVPTTLAVSASREVLGVWRGILDAQATAEIHAAIREENIPTHGSN